MSHTFPEPLSVTPSDRAVPLPVTLPPPDKVTVRLSALMPITTMLPPPASVNSLSLGTVTTTLMGLFALRLSGVFPMTSVPDCTFVVTRLRRLSSALEDDGLLRADLNHDVVAAGEFGAMERGHIAGLRRRYARPLHPWGVKQPPR